MKKELKNKLDKIEKEVKESYLLNQYKATHEALLDVHFQNLWLSTKEGQDEVGSEKAEELIEKNRHQLKKLSQRMDFLRKQLEKK